MGEIFTELEALYQKLKSFLPEAHWFCSKRSDEDYYNYEDPDYEEEDITPETKNRYIAEGRKRQDVAYRFAVVYGLASEDAEEWQQTYYNRLEELLTSCDKCVRNWHMGRRRFLKDISEEFTEELVMELSHRMDQADFARIDNGLFTAATLLRSLPHSERTLRSLTTSKLALTGLYEALCCASYHKSQEKIFMPLGDVLQIVQTVKVLRLGDIVPAMTRFLFDDEKYRHQFATTGWRKSSGKLTVNLFDWAVQDALVDAMQAVSVSGSPMADVQRFWEGFLLILDKLDEQLITHSLRGLQVQPDVYHLALMHLSYDSDDILELIIRALGALLQKSPKAFWAAYGTISPSTVAEQIFNCPAFQRLLARSHSDGMAGDINLPDAVAWIPSFVQSLAPAQQHEACRTILFNLLNRFQADRIPQASKLACCHASLSALVTTLATFVASDYKINASTSFIVINNVLGLVDEYKETVVGCAHLESDSDTNTELSKLGMQVIRTSLSLDCTAMEAEFSALEQETAIHQGLDNHSQSIWQAVLDSFRPNDVVLAQNILIGITPLVGLESFKPKGKGANPLTKDKIRFNRDFGQLIEIISRVFERLSEFSPANLRKLCSNPKTATPLFAALTSADQTTREASVEVLKTITGAERRKDALSQLLEEFLGPMLSSLSSAAARIYRLRTFSAVPYVLKTGRDVLESLCDTQNGILRIRTSPTPAEQNALKMWWIAQWRSVSTAFYMTEEWSEVNAKDYMTNFCRDIMDYADSLFDQYSLIASAIMPAIQTKASEKVSSDNSKLLLESPRKAMEGLVKYLRLKDPYLLISIVSLLSKLLQRLGEFNMEIETTPARYIEDAATNFVKTKLTEQQKAELIRALEEHNGLQIVSQSVSSISKKQSTIDAWSKSAMGINHEQSTNRSTERQGVIDLERWQSKAEAFGREAIDDTRSLTRGLEQGKSTLNEIRARQQVKTMIAPGRRAGESIRESRERERAEKMKRDAAVIANAKALRDPGRVAGEGSGLKGLGVHGKDHAPPRGEIMVSSDEESSDDEAAAKALISKTKEGSKKGKKEADEIRRRALLQPQGPVKKTKIIRSAKDMRARLIPNMDMLHLSILKWDIFHKGDSPPGGIDCQKVSDTFQTPADYKDTFYPLLISEAWRNLSTAKEENNSRPYEIKILNRMSVDQFYEISTSMDTNANPRDLMVMEGDIVQLSKGSDPMKDEQEPHCLARVHRTTRKKNVLEVSYRVNGTAVSNGGLLSALSPNLKIYGYKITSLTTIEREYAALSSLPYYDLCEEVLEAKPSPLLPYQYQVLDPIRKNYDVNLGQAKAIWSVKENDAFTLIQGPPGSGKTKTIVAMVGALLTDSFVDPGVAIARPHGAGDPVLNKKIQKKLLVCAPSNAAVDELVTRLKEGIKTLKGEFRKINVIRLGRSEAINTNVKDVTLDELVRIKIEGNNKNGNKVISEREKLHTEAGKLKEQLALLRPKLDEARAAGDKALELRVQRDIDGKKRDQARIGAKIDEDKDSGNTVARDNEIIRRRLQQEIIDGAHVLCATLSGSGHEMFKNLNVEFETVIIDEAAQCIELSALIPLKYGCSKCILVGDPKQLPPTVLSRSAARYGYEQSLFVRMQQNYPERIHLLDTQYRMHPDISRFPSQQFYDGNLVDGPDMALLRTKPWHASSLLGPYRFFDVKGVQTSGARGHSFINSEEINVAMQLYERLTRDYRAYDFTNKIGIITPYKAQLRELQARFQTKYGEDITEKIDFNTTDAFQGRESEVIIFSCVRARASGGIGFLDDIRRMNVGLTRAKSSLWVLGDSRSLLQGEFWAKLITDAQSREAYTDGDVMTLLRKQSAKSTTIVAQNTAGETYNSSSDVEMIDAPNPNINLKEEDFSSLPRNPSIVKPKEQPKSNRKSVESPKTNATISLPGKDGVWRPVEIDGLDKRPVVQATSHTPLDAESIQATSIIPTGPKLKRSHEHSTYGAPPRKKTTEKRIDVSALAVLQKDEQLKSESQPIPKPPPSGPSNPAQNARPAGHSLDTHRPLPSGLPQRPSPSTSSEVAHNAPPTGPSRPNPPPPYRVKKRAPADPLRRNLNNRNKP